MTDLLSIGASGLRAYKDALGTTGDNIANAETAGYVRRTIRLNEVTGSGEVPLCRAALTPGGVAVAGIQRSVDQWLAEDSRTSLAAAERAAARLHWLEAGERALDDGENGVGQSLTAMFNAADTLSADPSSTASRLAFLQSVSSAVDAFRTAAEQLQSVSDGIASAAQSAVDQVNSDVAALQRVNEGLLRARDGSTNQAALMDERDRLLDSLSGMLPITVTLDGRGAASVNVGVSGGPSLLNSTTASQFDLTTAFDGTLTFTLAGSPILPASGGLSGLASAASTIADARSALDQLADQFAFEINGAHQAGIDANGNPGGPLVNFSGTAATLTALTLTPEEVAAADSTSDNGNLLALTALRGATGTEEGWTQMVAEHAQAVSAARAQDSAASTRREGALEARAEMSGVDLDHEAAELLRFQQAYDGSARVIQVARETFQSIMGAL
jgi:flagellar hook-associated protein 1 FlgK